MHELSLAVSMVEEVEAILERENGQQVHSITVALGELSGVEAEALEACYPMAVEGTKLSDARLEIEHVPAEIECQDCGIKSRPEVPVFNCSNCGSRQVRVVAGREFVIRSMEIE